ncbi:uncharacterized protein [Venturia canescens]|uniref:uncharacterized protein isoform X2 n=1 Tax=Venturia canescens TaxID=32260 RepID=UPI001C9CFC5B|nr:uncharacterized protein LOC122415150 isoform X2 [Venturia canescens]
MGVFFSWADRFCETHPQYTKYFTSDSQVPLTFDARTNAKFTVIMETMGYLLLDFHKKPKQLDRIIGYIAMIHKDMSLARSDMLNFCEHLLNYLTVTFPLAMTPECLEVTTRYMNHLMAELSQKIEDFQNEESTRYFENAAKYRNPCGSWLLCTDNLIYGQTLDYWKQRKVRWEELLEDWRIKETSAVQVPKNSSTEDEETSMIKSKTEDEISEFAESTARLLESHGIPRTTRIDTKSRSLMKEIQEPRQKFGAVRLTDQEAKSKIKPNSDTLPENSVSTYKTPRERRRSNFSARMVRMASLVDEKTKSSLRMSAEFPDSMELKVPTKGQKMNLLARERRRTTLAHPTHFPASDES